LWEIDSEIYRGCPVFNKSACLVLNSALQLKEKIGVGIILYGYFGKICIGIHQKIHVETLRFPFQSNETFKRRSWLMAPCDECIVLRQAKNA
jgi:hypothetical protein